MTKSLSHGLKRIVAGLCAGAVMWGAVPTQPVADVLKSAFTVEANAVTYDNGEEPLYCGALNVNDIIISTADKPIELLLDYWNGDKVYIGNEEYSENFFVPVGEYYVSEKYVYEDESSNGEDIIKYNSYSVYLTSLSGATFNFDPSDYLPEGYVADDNGDGTYTVHAAGTKKITFDESVPNGAVTSMKTIDPDNELVNADHGYFYVGKQATIVSKAELTFSHYNSKNALVSWRGTNYNFSWGKGADGKYTYTFTMPDEVLVLSHTHSVVVECSDAGDKFYMGCELESDGLKEIARISAFNAEYDPVEGYTSASTSTFSSRVPSGVTVSWGNMYYTDRLSDPVECEVDPSGHPILPAGEYYVNMIVAVDGTDDYDGEYEIFAPFTISPKSIADNDITVTVTPASNPYTEGENKPTVTVKDGDITLVEGEDKDYTVAYDPESVQNVGNYTITITGKGNYTGTRTAYYSITAADTSDQITFEAQDKVYDAQEYSDPVPTAADGTLGKDLLSNAQVTYSYYNYDESKYAASAADFVYGKLLKPEVEYVIKDKFGSDDSRIDLPGGSYYFNRSHTSVGTGLSMKTICFHEDGTFTGTAWNGNKITYYYDTSKVFVVTEAGTSGYQHTKINVVDKLNALKGTQLDPAPTNVGHYIAKATITGSDNFQAVTKYDDFEITRATITLNVVSDYTFYGNINKEYTKIANYMSTASRPVSSLEGYKDGEISDKDRQKLIAATLTLDTDEDDWLEFECIPKEGHFEEKHTIHILDAGFYDYKLIGDTDNDGFVDYGTNYKVRLVKGSDTQYLVGPQIDFSEDHFRIYTDNTNARVITYDGAAHTFNFDTNVSEGWSFTGDTQAEYHDWNFISNRDYEVRDSDGELISRDEQGNWYDTQTNAGAYTYHVIPVGARYLESDRFPTTFTIQPKEVTFSVSGTDYTYTGTEIDPSDPTKRHHAFTVMDGDTTLVEGTDYEFQSISAKTDVGEYDYTIVGINNYRGSLKSGKWTITAASTEGIALNLTTASGSYDYNGSPVASTEFTVVAADPNNTVSVAVATIFNNLSDEDKQFSYRIAGTNGDWIAGIPTDAGTYEIRALISSSNLIAWVYAYGELTINKLPVVPQFYTHTFSYGAITYEDVRDENVDVLGPIDWREYAPVTADRNYVHIELGLEGTGSIAVGTYTVTPTLTGDKAGNYYIATNKEDAPYDMTLTVAKFDIENVNRDPDSGKITVTYKGVAQYPEFTLKNRNNHVDLVAGTDYTVTYYKGYDNKGEIVASPTNVGMYYVEITGAGNNYTGTTNFAFEIEPYDLTDAYEHGNIYPSLDPTGATYTGSSVAPAVTVKVDHDDDNEGIYETTLTEGTDYVVSYRYNNDGVSDIIAVGNYTIVITGRGNYSKIFEIGPFTVSRASITPANFKLTLNEDKTVYDGEPKTLDDFTFGSAVENPTAVEQEVIEGYKAGTPTTTITDVQYAVLPADKDGVLTIDEMLAPGSEYTFTDGSCFSLPDKFVSNLDFKKTTITVDENNCLAIAIPDLDYSYSKEAPVGYVWKVTEYIANFYPDQPLYAISLVSLASENLLVFSEGLPTNAGFYAVKYTVKGESINDATLYDSFVIEKRDVTVTAGTDKENNTKEYLGVPATLIGTPAAKSGDTGVVEADARLDWNSLIGLSKDGVLVNNNSGEDWWLLPADTYDIVGKYAEAEMPAAFDNYNVTVTAGTYTVTPYDLSAHADDIYVTLTPSIRGDEFDSDVTADVPYFTYDGSKHGVKVDDGTRPDQDNVLSDFLVTYGTVFFIGLTEGTDFEVNGKKTSISARTTPFELELEGAGNFTGTYYAPWYVAQAVNDTAAITNAIGNPITEIDTGYDGEEICWFDEIGLPADFYVNAGRAENATIAVKYYEYDANNDNHKGTALAEGTAPKNAGKYVAEVTITDDDGNYATVTKYLTITITKAALEITPTLSGNTAVFGKTEPTVDSVTITSGAYYESESLAEFKEDVMAMYTKTETVNGQYRFVMTDSYKALLAVAYPNYDIIYSDSETVTVQQASIKNAKVATAKVALKSTGSTSVKTGITSVTFTTDAGEVLTLVEGIDYEVDDVKTKRAGTYTLDLEGIGNYTGVKSVEVEVAEDERSALIVAKSMSLTDGIYLTFKLELDKDALKDKGAYIHFTTEQGLDKTMLLTEGKKQSGRYVYALGIAPDHMGDVVTATVYFSDGVIADTCQYSVVDYATSTKEKYATNEKLVYLLDALLNYGAASQNVTGYDIENLVNGSVTTDFPDMINISTDYDLVEDGGATNLTYGMSLSLTSEVGIRMRISTTGKRSDYTYGYRLPGSEEIIELPLEKIGSNYYIIIHGVTPDNLDTMYEFVVTHKDTSTTVVKYSALTYIKTMLARENTTPAMKGLLRSLYYFNAAADSILE